MTVSRRWADMRRVAIRAFSAGWAAVPVALLLGTVVLGPASPASADDPLPLPIVPSGMTAPPEVLVPATDGPGTIATQLPGPTESLSPPSKQQIDDARAALDRLKKAGKTAAPHAEVAAPKASSSVASRFSDQAWWTIGAGLLVLVVASETTRLSVRRAKHRKAE
jgi:hypothetical protein